MAHMGDSRGTKSERGERPSHHRSRRRDRSRSVSPGGRTAKKARASDAVRESDPPRPMPRKDVALDAELSAEEIQMMMAMGIPFGFESTQGKHVDDKASNQGAVKVATKRSARQYMNRKGGFNKALPAERTGEKVHIEGYARR